MVNQLHKRESIKAHFTIIFAGHAVSREIRRLTGLSIERFGNFLKPLCTGVVSFGGTVSEAPPLVEGVADNVLWAIGMDFG